MKLKCLETDLPFWDKLTKEEQEIIKKNAATRKYKKGEIIHSNGNECMGLLLVQTGELRTYLMSEEGKEVTLYRVFPCEVSVLAADCLFNNITFDTHIEATQDTETILIPLTIFSKIMKNIYVENFVYKMISKRFSDAMWSMEQILFMGFDKRLAIFLLDESIKNESNVIKITHEEIAKYIGSAREVVSRMVKYFESEGILSLSRGKLEIKNINKLRELS